MGFTLPKYRGQHIGERRRYCGLDDARQRGITKKQSFIASTNFSSLATEKRNANKCVGYAGYVEIFGKLFFYHSPKVKNIGFEFFEHIV
jgi:hypothetical protein